MFGQKELKTLTRNPYIEVRLPNWLHFISNLTYFEIFRTQIIAFVLVIMELFIRVRNKKYFLFSQPKHMLWVLKRTVSMRRFF